jgi:D-alanine--poly(phosphoribitol) ligase subunit 1
VLLCGEVLSNECASRLLDRFPGLGLYNTYGPTEATVAVTSVRIDRGLIDRYHPLPVGRAKPDCYVGPLDAAGNRAKDGTRGEIVIEGPSVGPGYLHAPELTERAFYEAARPGGTVRGYRTGDWGHVEDGFVFYSGRIDAQIKLRGHRIEIEDVENNLRAIPSVGNAVVVANTKDGRCESLTAFMTASRDELSRIDFRPQTFVEEVRAALRERVPDYMVPKNLVVRKALPLSVNGKIDRRRLAEELTAK